jgi:glycosyltransferase involved in cell wall biosynthesis
MADRRLVKALANVNPAEIDRVFGHEGSLIRTGGSSSDLAPVQRVAILAESFFPKVDGVAKLAYLTLRYLQESGREVLVIAPDIAPPQVGSSKVVQLGSFSLPCAPETRVAMPWRSVARALDDFQPDMIHLFSPAIMSVAGMRNARHRHIPVVANYQTDLPAYTQHYGYGFLTAATDSWLRYIHNGCHLTLVPSNFTLNQLRAKDYERLRVWRRGVDVHRYNPAHRSQECRERLLAGRDPNSLLCLYVGRLATEKRVDLLLDIARLPGVALTIVGDGAERDNLERLFAGTGTVFTGYLYGEALASAYASADVFVFPGPSETFGQVVQEAMSSGLPAVIINRGGITDLVQDGSTGYVCSEDPQAFAAAVQKLKDDPTQRRTMAQRARHNAEQHPWTTIMTQLETHYWEALQLNQRLHRMARPAFTLREVWSGKLQ